MSNEATKTFYLLKLFPRHKNGAIDTGKILGTTVRCPQCGDYMEESVSLEFCSNCGHVETDYWGIIKSNDWMK